VAVSGGGGGGGSGGGSESSESSSSTSETSQGSNDDDSINVKDKNTYVCDCNDYKDQLCTSCIKNNDSSCPSMSCAKKCCSYDSYKYNQESDSYKQKDTNKYASGGDNSASYAQKSVSSSARVGGMSAALIFFLVAAVIGSAIAAVAFSRRVRIGQACSRSMF